jgi:hypothetical protein
MSGLIGLAIIAIWLVVLVPMWLNRHEAEDASRSMDSFSTAMRVLSRRASAQGDRRYVVMPRRDNWGVTVDNNPDAKARGRFPLLRPPFSAAGLSGRARLLARRRRVALSVATLMVVLAFTAALGITSWWYELAVDLAAAGYVIHLRNEALRASELRRRRLARSARAAVGGLPDDAPAWRRPPVEPFVAPDEALPPAPVSAAGTENGSRWEPVPVPLPTYVSKPVVQRPAASTPRADVDSTTIDLTRPGAWSEWRNGSDVRGASDGRSASDDRDGEIDHRHLLLDESGSARISASAGAPQQSASVAQVEDDELDVILQRRRAVGD